MAALVCRRWVCAEAATAQAQGKLVNVRPADMSFRDIPEPFNVQHIDEVEDHGRILSTIARVMAGTPVATRVPLHEIYFLQHGHRLIDPKQGTLARDPHEVSPTQLLQARFGVVGYLDVTGVKASLVEWCIGSSRITAGRLVHAYQPGVLERLEVEGQPGLGGVERAGQVAHALLALEDEMLGDAPLVRRMRGARVHLAPAGARISRIAETTQPTGGSPCAV